MRNVDIRTVQRSELVDINVLDIKTSLPFIEKVHDYLTQTDNAYCFLCGDVIIKVSHSKTTTTLTDCMEEIIRSL